MTFLHSVGNFFRKHIGKVSHVVKKIGQFVVNHHQPLAILANGAAEMTNNPIARGLGAAGLVASGIATANGIGQDHLGLRRAAGMSPG